MSEDILFNAEDTVAPAAVHGAWTVLIVDDDSEVHSVTTLALAGFVFAGKPLRFLHAHSGAEARVLLASRLDIALVLLDVVMETEHAGLELVEHVRKRIGNRFFRIILRTGQPGQAPELEVITKYDINDYKYKTELTRERLFTTVYTGLSTYRDLIALEASRRGLEKVIEASARIFELRELENFAQGVLEQLAALLFLDCDALIADISGLAAAAAPGSVRVIAATGAYRHSVDHDAAALPAPVLARMREALSRPTWTCGDDYFVAHRADFAGTELVFYVDAGVRLPPPDRHLLELFCRNVMIARENLRMIAGERGKAA
jgi:CheY-like chemotaxis protein